MAGVFVSPSALIFVSCMRTISLFIAASLLLSACEKDVSVNLQEQEQQLVVEGKIETGGYPQVVLSRSLGYFSAITPAQLLSSFVHKATVTVNDGSTTVQLKELNVDTNGVRLYYYGIDTTRPSSAFKGERGKKYTLRIIADNKSYNAVTTIPAGGMRLDSAWWHHAGSGKDSTKVRLWAKVTDPDLRGNYVRYFTKRNKGPYLATLNSVIDDQVVNGTTFEIPLDAGINKNERPELDEYAFFRKGDTVLLKFCNIDKGTYDFWRTLDFAYTINGNPFASPVKIIGNIPGASGYWGGYTVAYRKVVIRKK